MIKVLIIEDDYVWQTKIEMMLSNYKQFEIIGFAENAYKAQQLVDLKKPDLLISDVFLGSDNVLNSLNTLFNKIPTLFISSFQNENSLKSILSFPNSIFLIKPFHDFSLFSSLSHIVKHSPNFAEDLKFLSFTGVKGGFIKVPFENIVKIEVEGNYSICSTADNKRYAKKISLNLFIKLLDKSFIRVNKNTVLNLKYISRIDYVSKLVYVNENKYQLGRTYYKAVKFHKFNY
jgi:two-component system, LytTR family, response regulator LytT